MPQAPLEQVAVPLALEQSCPQPPQLPMLVLVLTSQPLLRASLSQFAKPVVHVMPQTPAVHDALPLAVEQAWPQPPQFAALVLVFASQPLLRALPSQLAKPAAHTMLQAPAEQDAVPLALEQAWPQPPQWPMLVFVLASQPLLRASPSQLPKPTLQLMPQVPAEHVAVPLALEQV
jgi:hypothetical protein